MESVQTVVVACHWGKWPQSAPQLAQHYVSTMRRSIPAETRFVLFCDRPFEDAECMPFPDKLCEAWARKGAFSLCKLAAFSPWTPIGTRILFTDLDNVVRRWDRILTAIPPDALIVAGVGPYDFSAGMFGFTVTPKTLKWYDEMPDNCTHASNDEEWLMCRVGYPLRGSRRSPQHGAWVPFYGSENRDMVKLFKHGVNIDSKTLPPNCDAVLFYGNPRPHTVEQPWNPLYVRV